MLSYYIVLSEKRKAQKLVLAFVPPALHNMGISTGKEGSHAAHHRRALRHHRPKIHQKHAPARAVPGWRNSDHRTEPAPLVANRPLCTRKARLDCRPAAAVGRPSRRDRSGFCGRADSLSLGRSVYAPVGRSLTRKKHFAARAGNHFIYSPGRRRVAAGIASERLLPGSAVQPDCRAAPPLGGKDGAASIGVAD